MAAYEVWGSDFWDGIARTLVAFDGHPVDRNIGDWARGDDVPGFYCWAHVAHTYAGYPVGQSIIGFSDPRAAVLFRFRWG